MTGHAVWIDGSLSGGIDPADRGLLLGDGVFDTLVAFNGIPFAGDRHLERLTAQAASIGITVDPEAIRAGWAAALGQARENAVILRTTATRGAAPRGLWPKAPGSPTVIVSTTPWDANVFGAPVRLIVSDIHRNAGSPTSRIKALGYLDNILAARQAADSGAHDAILLSPSGHVACSTIANVFALRGTQLVTPPSKDGAMPGIMRTLVLEQAAGIGLIAAEESLQVEELASADAVFLTNSVRFLQPVISLAGKSIAGHGRAAMDQLMDRISGLVWEACGYSLISRRERGSPAGAES